VFKSTIIIPVSGNTNHIENVVAVQRSLITEENYFKIILVFDEKDGSKSEENFTTLKENIWSHTELIKGKFGNVGEARNRGLQEVSTRWFSFCDADDQIVVDNYLTLLQQVDISDAHLALGGYLAKRDKVEVSSNLPEKDFINWLEIARNPGLWRYIYKSEYFKEILFPPLNMAEDQIYLSQIYGLQPKILVSQLPICSYEIHSLGSLTSTNNEIVKITEALQLSKSIKYSGQSPYREIQRGFRTAQLLTSIKHTSALMKIKNLLILARHLFICTPRDIYNSLRFVSYCLRSK